MKRSRLIAFGGLAATVLLLSGGTANAQEGPSAAELKVVVDTLWVLITAFLVFFMNAGFGCVEAGFCRAKNATNILGKNFVVFAISTLAFWAVGWTIMFGVGNDYFGYTGWFVSGSDSDYASIEWAKVPLMAKFFFQLVFAGTAATIVSGCVAERIHYKSFMFFTVFIAAISYPVTGHWIWGGGWLATYGFWDFAGSTVVHSVGGWAGLAGILLLGSRLGKYRPNGSIQPIPGHSMALAFIGALILWLGWFGFNPGSTMAADPTLISHIVLTTNMACATGMLAATVVAWILLGKPDFSMTVNGALAGLVAVTAPCAWVTVVSAMIIGAIGGVLVVLAVLFFDRIRIDDPVGALSVHLVNGIWGTLAVGVFADPETLGYGEAGPAAGLLVGGGAAQLIKQLVGVGAVAAFTFVGSFVVWAVIKFTIGLRVDPDHEIHGLDVSEMGMEAYNGFQVSDPHEHILPINEPRAATAPPGTLQRFTVMVEGVNYTDLASSWSELCKPSDGPTPEAFKSIYPFMTTVQGNRFNFKGGDREIIRNNLESLLKERLKKNVKVYVQ